MTSLSRKISNNFVVYSLDLQWYIAYLTSEWKFRRDRGLSTFLWSSSDHSNQDRVSWELIWLEPPRTAPESFSDLIKTTQTKIVLSTKINVIQIEPSSRFNVTILRPSQRVLICSTNGRSTNSTNSNHVRRQKCPFLHFTLSFQCRLRKAWWNSSMSNCRRSFAREVPLFNEPRLNNRRKRIEVRQKKPQSRSGLGWLPVYRSDLNGYLHDV